MRESHNILPRDSHGGFRCRDLDEDSTGNWRWTRHYLSRSSCSRLGRGPKQEPTKNGCPARSLSA